MLTLTDKDLQELQQLIGDFRYKEAMAIIQFVNGKQQAAAAAAAPSAGKPDVADVPASPPVANGHDNQTHAVN